MAESGIAKKLLMKPGQRVLILNALEGYREGLGQVPEGVELTDKPEGLFDLVHLFVTNVEELNRLAPTAIGAIKRDGLLWMSYPKGSSKIKTDLSRDKGWDVVNNAGLRVVSMVSIDDTWSAMRFRPAELYEKKDR